VSIRSFIVSIRLCGSVCVLLFVVCPLFAQSKPPVLMAGMGEHHHKISTQKSEAQQFFDQGLSLVYAFNHDEAVRSFRRAAELDPRSAMAFWGIALALGPCINLDVDPPHEKAAFEAAQSALSLRQARHNVRGLTLKLSRNATLLIREWT